MLSPSQRARETWYPRSLASRVLNRPQARVPRQFPPLLTTPLQMLQLESKKRTGLIRTESHLPSFGRGTSQNASERQRKQCHAGVAVVLMTIRVEARTRKDTGKVTASGIGKETWYPRSLASRVLNRPQARVPRRLQQNGKVEPKREKSVFTRSGQPAPFVPSGVRTVVAATWRTRNGTS